MGSTDNNKDKNAEEIMEETMQHILDDLEENDTKEEAPNTEPELDDFQLEEIDLGLEEDPSEEAEEDNFAEENPEEDDLTEEDLEEDSEEDDFEEEDSEENIFEKDDFAEDIFAEADFGEEDSEEEDSDAEKELKKHRRRKKAGVIAASILGVLLVAYIGIAFYFSSHFMFFTSINGTDVAMKNVSQVESYMKQQVADYVLTLEESDGDAEAITGTDISIEYVPGDKVEKLVKAQNNFLWITTLWNHPEIESEIGVDYNETKLSSVIEKLACMQPDNQIASVDAHPEFQNTQFVVVPEVVGTQINTDVFNEKVKEAISGFQSSLNLTDSGSYIQPKFLSDSEEVVNAAAAMNNYLGANITYDFNPDTVVVDASVISQWVKVNENMEVTFDEEAVKAYIASLAEKYNTKGKPRQFTTATGNVVTVEGGGYGWKIDQDAEYAALTANIQNAETVTREVAYSSRAASHAAMDMGSTYAEVDLTNQVMYFIKDGAVALQTPVVTGNPNKGNATPQGVYSLSYKDKDAVLRGEKKPDGTYSYETPVKYWMPFNGGIGFHDASWQPTFGGSRYKSHGSHGCVNMPPNMAAQLFDLISAGTPVVCHY